MVKESKIHFGDDLICASGMRHLATVQTSLYIGDITCKLCIRNIETHARTLLRLATDARRKLNWWRYH